MKLRDVDPRFAAPLFVVLLCATNLFMQGGFCNLAPCPVDVFGVRLGARAAGLSQASNGFGKIMGPMSLAVFAGTGNLLTPHATEAATLPAFLRRGPHLPRAGDARQAAPARWSGCARRHPRSSPKLFFRPANTRLVSCLD